LCAEYQMVAEGQATQFLQLVQGQALSAAQGFQPQCLPCDPVLGAALEPGPPLAICVQHGRWAASCPECTGSVSGAAAGVSVCAHGKARSSCKSCSKLPQPGIKPQPGLQALMQACLAQEEAEEVHEEPEHPSKRTKREEIKAKSQLQSQAPAVASVAVMELPSLEAPLQAHGGYA
jgi:hypothetical protein